MAIPCVTRSMKPIALLCLLIASFLLGILTRTLIYVSPPLKGNMTPGTRSTLDEPDSGIPRGLDQYQRSYQNPWTFSVFRTDLEQLEETADKVLKQQGAFPRVVVSFTSLPARFSHYAYDLIQLLKEQDYEPDMIYIAVPMKSRRSEREFEIPEWANADPRITVLRPPIDYGPATKLIPALQAELKLGYNDSRIITVDDDNEGRWSRKEIIELLLYSLHFPDAAIGFTGWNVTCMLKDAHCSIADSGIPTRQFPERMYNFVRHADDYACHTLADWKTDYFSYCLGAIRKNYVGFVDVLEGYKGVMYQPRFFDVASLEQIRKLPTTWDSLVLVDDVWFSGWLSLRNITRLVVNPAVHSDSSVYQTMIRASRKRNLTYSADVTQPPEQSSGEQMEKGLHDLGDFSSANHLAVLWFEKKGAWDQGLWNRPSGYQYPSEMKNRIVRNDLGV